MLAILEALKAQIADLKAQLSALDAENQSDIGLSRLNNEDVFASLQKENFFVLADGMGGHNAGKIAAQTTVDKLCHYVKQASHHPHSPEEWKTILSDAIFETNLHVFQMAEQNVEHKGMGTTLCLSLIVEKQLIIGHVGDSRIYRFRKGRLTRLTQDHSLKGELIASGKLDEESAQNSSKKNIISRAIGTQMTVASELATFDIESDDLYLLCSNGLTDLLSDATIADHLEKASTLKEANENLILAAKEAGGSDNITLLCFEVTY